MKKSTFYLSLSLCLALLSCSDGGYKVEGDMVSFENWTFSFGPQKYVLYDADPNSFETLKDWLAKDKQHVWYQQAWIEGADPASIKADKQPLCHDANDYYFKGEALHVSDMQTFKVIDLDSYFIGKDKNYCYTTDGRFKITDYKAFERIGYRHSTDSHHVYYYTEVVEGADPKTFEEDQTASSVGKDKNGIYEGIHRVETNSPDAYTNIGFGYGRDEHNIYYEGRRCPDIDASTFEMTEAIWAKDKDHIIAKGKPLEGADTASFVTVWYSAYDNDQAWYNGEELPDIDMETFTCDSSWATDSLHIYHQGHLLEGVIPSEVKMDMDYVVAKDKVWYGDKILQDADAASFEIIEDPQGPNRVISFDARDKSWHYLQGKKVCRTENVKH